MSQSGHAPITSQSLERAARLGGSLLATLLAAGCALVGDPSGPSAATPPHREISVIGVFDDYNEILPGRAIRLELQGRERRGAT